ncbi:uncharacterized protein LOC131930528 [Physella acuta]|uniref:uncharacterized protein LOC131930528 n=1 Tax=Physella acuta TaxID=109671 RepID=UPI0027DCCA40|nr:uncharacterized protein LOC131930528 [Physella acuta]
MYFNATLSRVDTKYVNILYVKNVSTRFQGISYNIYQVPKVYSKMFILNVYAKPIQISCASSHLESSSTNTTLSCRTEQIFPELLCVFFSKNQVLANASIMYENLNVTVGTSRYYTSTCNITIDLNKLGQGQHTFSATLYPNVTSGLQYGVNSSTVYVNLTLAKAVLDPSCPGVTDYIKVGASSVCRCNRSSVGNPPGRVEWFTSNNLPVATPGDEGGSVVLRVGYNASNRQLNFTCRGVSSVGVEDPGVLFQASFEFPSSVSSFTIDLSTQLNPSIGGYVKLTCLAEGNPPPQMTISRKGTRSSETRENGTRRLSLAIPSLACVDIDEYWCTADNGVAGHDNTSASVRLVTNCSVHLQADETNNRIFPVVKGRDVFIKVKVFGYPNPSSYSLKYLIQGSPYEIRQQRYTVVYTETTPFYGSANLAIFGVQEQDFTQFIFTISNGVGDGLDFHFTVQEEQDNNLALGVGLGISLPLVALGIIAAVLALVIRKRRAMSSRDPKPANYDDVIVTQTDEHRYGVVNQSANIYDLPDLNNEQPQPMTNNYSNVTRLGDSNLYAQKNPEPTFNDIKTQSGNKATAQIKLNYENIEIEEKC